MQCLYAVETESGGLTEEKAVGLLKKYLEHTADLFTFMVYLLTEVARYAEIDAKNKASKHLPSAEDLNVNTKISGNTLLWKILEQTSFQQAVKNRNLSAILDEEIVRKIYSKLLDADIYRTYINQESREKKTEKELLSFIFTDLIMADEAITEYIEDHFVQWDDDCEMIFQMVLNYLSKPVAYDFKQIVGIEKTNYAISLLKTAIEKKDHTMELIIPKLKNWDSDRIALLDMIMIRLGICELLYFETIPAKVTLNEYIDIAKSYSTTQSGHFVNGIMDSIHKDLFNEGRLKKVDFKKLGGIN
jgi:N utilization substance protein B